MNETVRDDAVLVDKYFEGDDAAFEQLVKKHIDHVYAFALRLTADPQMAEDVTQEAFVNAWKHLERFDRKRKFTTWILSITHNVAIDHLRKKKDIPLSSFDGETGGNAILDTAEDSLPLPDELFAGKELGSILARALNTLPAKERAMIALHHEQQMTFEEIAEVLGKSRNTVKSQYRRTMLKLRNMLVDDINKNGTP